MAIDKKKYSSNEKAILVSINTPAERIETTHEHVQELSELCKTVDIEPVASVIQKLDRPNVSTYVGKGKLEEIKTLIGMKEATMVIFDDDLSPSQVRNIERDLDCKILDRSLLILDIFAMRAMTSQAKIQVELAQYQYLLPRLTRMWTHLTKQKGGSPGMRGPGEKELETDRRIINEKVALLKKKLKIIETRGEVQRKQRDRMVRVTLVGYTNVGKSTLMRLISKTNVLAENKLFATIGSTVRKVVFNDIPYLLTDTVGFIRKLPHTLIECFKSTLEEVKQADILLHVIDFSHPSYEDHINVVDSTLKEIGVKDIPVIMVFNKIDKLNLSDEDKEELKKDLRKRYSAFYNNTVVFISALEKENIEDLKDIIFKKVKKKHMTIYPNYVIKSLH
jgi:GTP-binding protein HflX